MGFFSGVKKMLGAQSQSKKELELEKLMPVFKTLISIVESSQDKDFVRAAAFQLLGGVKSLFDKGKEQEARAFFRYMVQMIHSRNDDVFNMEDFLETADKAGLKLNEFVEKIEDDGKNMTLFTRQ